MRDRLRLLLAEAGRASVRFFSFLGEAGWTVVVILRIIARRSKRARPKATRTDKPLTAPVTIFFSDLLDDPTASSLLLCLLLFPELPPRLLLLLETPSLYAFMVSSSLNHPALCRQYSTSSAWRRRYLPLVLE